MDEKLMNEENQAAVPESNTAQNYIDAMQDLRSRLDNSVPRELYEKAIDENRLLANAYANGLSMPTGDESEERRSSRDICKYILENKGKLNSLETVKAITDYRDAVLFETGEDVFVSKGHHINPSNGAFESSEKTANIYRECIDYANGDNQLFVQEVQRRMVENPAANIINNNKR